MTVTTTKISPLGAQLNQYTPVVLATQATGEILSHKVYLIVGAQKILIADNGAWLPGFENNSSTTEITPSKEYNYSIVPNTGWIYHPTLDVQVVETPAPETFENVNSLQTPGGTAQYVDIGENFNWPITKAFSTSCYYKGTDTSWYIHLLSNYWQAGYLAGWTVQNYYNLDPSAPNRPVFELIGDNVANFISTAADVVINDGAWHMITCTYDGSEDNTGIKVYVDGSLPTQLYVNNDTITVFEHVDQRGQIFNDNAVLNSNNGLLNSVCIFDRVLTPSEVAELWAHRLPGTNAPGDYRELPFADQMLGYWWMGNGDDHEPILVDRSGHNQHGALVGLSESNFIADAPS